MRMVTPGSPAFTTPPAVALAVLFLTGDESSALAVKKNIPSLEGVPEITPVAGSSASPSGMSPIVMVQVYGWSPPMATSCA